MQVGAPFCDGNGVVSVLRLSGEWIIDNTLLRMSIMNIIRLFLIVVMGFGLSACVPARHETDQLIPPPTQEGFACASHCLQQRTECDTHCRVLHQRCLSAQEGLKHEESLLSVDPTPGMDRPGHPYPSGLNCSSSACEQECSETYRQCYEGCGGRIVKGPAE